jgi:hypothetical protein
MILQSQPPQHSEAGALLLAAGREATKGAVKPVPKVAPLPAQISTLFKTLAMACANFTTTMPIGLTGAFCPVLGWKTNSLPDPFRFGSFSHTCHCHGHAFSCKRWLDFLGVCSTSLHSLYLWCDMSTNPKIFSSRCCFFSLKNKQIFLIYFVSKFMKKNFKIS